MDTIKRTKLSYKLTIWIVSVSAIFTIITSAILLNNDYNKRITQFEQNIIDIKKNNEKILELSIWHYDEIAINEILKDIVDKEKVTFAQIKINEKIVYSLGKKETNNVIKKEFILNKEVKGHIYKIGELTIQGNLNYIKKDLKEVIRRDVLLEILKLIFLSIIIIFLIKKLFINKLEKLATYTANLHIANLDEVLVINTDKNVYQDELDRVIESFNIMRINLLSEISNTKKIKLELTAFREAVENSYNSIVITTPKRKIVYVNKVFEKLTGYSKEEVLNKNPSILKPNNANALYYKNMNKTLNNGEIWEGELVNQKKDGTYFYEKASIIPIFIENKLTNFLAIKLDITDYKESVFKINKLNSQLEKKVIQRTKELEKSNLELLKNINDLENTKLILLETEKIANTARKQAEDANRGKSLFLANITHELKTPLNGINGLVYLTKLKTNNTKIHDNLNDINTYSETLLRLISDLLDTSKIDAKEIEIIDKVFNLNELLNSIDKRYKVECKNKGIDFISSIHNSNENKLVGDSIRIHQVITNLINNAINFTNTNNGFVKFIVSCTQLDKQNVKLDVEITDNGIGIKKEDLNSIFNPFYQTENSLKHYEGGTGLGLNICKKIIEQMNGIIYVESEIDKGSSFFVSLNIKIDDENNNINPFQRKIVNAISYKKVLVLIVDDNTINLDVLEGILHSQEIECKLAKNGLEALELIDLFDFNLIITDIKMPKMNGFQLVKEVRLRYTCQELPIIVISANSQESYADCFKEFEINDFIQKPIEPVILIKKLSEYINLKENYNEINREIKKNYVILDVEDALLRFMNNDKLYRSALKDFLDDIINSKSKINSLIENDKQAEFLNYLHTIKGLSGNLSAKKFSETVSRLYDTVKLEENYDSLLIEFQNDLELLEVSILSYLKEDKKIDIVLNNIKEIDEEERKKILLELLKLTKAFNTKAINFFETMPDSLKIEDLVISIKKDIEKYNFKEATKKIEQLF